MRISKITIPLISLAAVLLISSHVFGVSSYTTSFNARYGTAAGTALGANSSARCILCHPGGNTSQYTSYANDFRNNNHNYATIEPLDSDGDGFSNLAEITALTLPYDANSRPTTSADTTLPVVSTFTVPATATTLTVPISALTATDNVGVTGYLVNESATKPAAGNWPAAAPTSYTFTTAGAKTLYAWARDAAGNVSNSLSRPVTVTLPPTADTTLPVVSTFTVPTTATTLTVPISALTATDNVGVTGYLVNESATKPAAGNWPAAAPTSYTFTTAGTKTLYAWARDAAGNVSNALSRPVTVTLPPTADTTLPVVSTFTVPTTATTLTVPISALTATDNVGVTGYLVNESATKPAAGNWPAAAPTSYTFTTAGTKTLYAWARDAAGNVSNSLSRPVTVTLPPTADTTLPVVSTFTIPATATTLTVPISALTATDNVGVTGYLVNESATKPAAGNWPAAAPTSYTFTTAGAKTLYAGRDAAGNVSNALSRSVTVTSGDSGGVDVESPEVMEFTLPLTGTSLTVPIMAFRAIDNISPTAYLITTTPTAPSASDPGWRATPPTSYTFTSAGAKTLYGWAKDAAGNVSESVWDNVGITAPPQTTSYTLSVSRAGTGSGTVTSAPAGVSCGTDCSQTYAAGTQVSLTAAASPGSVFSGWSGACTGPGTCTVTLSAARSVTATFNTAPAGSAPNISAPSSYSFGETHLDSTSSRTIVVSNTGSTTLRVTGITKSGTDAGMFTVGVSSFTVAPGGTYNLPVTFRPTSEGTKNATLRLSTNDPDTAVWQISLSGRGED